MEENKLTYKEAMAEIEDIVTKLENNQLDVDELSGKVKRVSGLLFVNPNCTRPRKR